ncbi:MAG: pentapeptide repeat-containing protein, partial [Candidatus Dormibacteraeota bacterium]|nr:pentapeptide repeat-containing protein [Candidatus Dormibacteraeota bacterium]
MVIVWRKRDRRLRATLVAGKDHRGADFSRARLVAMDLRAKVLAEANLEWADLTESDLRGAHLAEA